MSAITFTNPATTEADAVNRAGEGSGLKQVMAQQLILHHPLQLGMGFAVEIQLMILFDRLGMPTGSLLTRSPVR